MPFCHLALLQIIFPADWKWMPSGITDFPPEDFILERASTADFTDAEDISQPYSPAGLAWAAMDVAWEGPRPWYRVRLKHQGKIIATSDPQKPLDNYGQCECWWRTSFCLQAQGACACHPGALPHPAERTVL